MTVAPAGARARAVAVSPDVGDAIADGKHAPRLAAAPALPV